MDSLAIAPRIGKCLRLLASPADGEKLAAIAALDRTLKAVALDFNDLAKAAEWWAVVNRMPADWFPRETHGLLTQYCRHVVNARRVAQLITKCEKQKKLDVTDYNQLLIMQEREGRAISSLATRMRLTQQTVHDREKKKPHQVAKPWET